MRKLVRLFVACAAIGACAVPMQVQAQAGGTGQVAPVADAQPDAIVQGMFTTLMVAVQTNNYKAFIANVSDELKKALPEKDFQQVSANYAPRFKTGYTSVYFGQMTKLGGDVYFWKLVFKDKGDDVLVQVSIKNGKVNGVYLF